MEKFRYVPKTKLNNLPKAPGVYTLSSPKTILYIGKAGNLRERVKNHFAQPSYRDHLFINQVTKIGYIKTDSEIDALILESQLIKKRQPKYNVIWKDDKKYFYVAITKEKLPRVFLTHQPVLSSTKELNGTVDRAEYIGPFTEGKSIKLALRLLRRVFPYYTGSTSSRQATKKHGPSLCQYCQLNLCPGPAPNEQAYKKNLRNLVSVLRGKRTSVLGKLEKEMKKAAGNQSFEKAGELRNQLLSLERIASHARILSGEPESSVSWQLTEKELQKLFSTKKRISRIEAYDISNIQGKEATGSQVTFLKGVPAKEEYRKYKIRWPGEVSRLAAPSAHRSQRNFPRGAKQLAPRPNDFAMMRELLKRRLRHQEWPYPQVMVIDGGKGQLSSAVLALKESGVKGILLCALAKRQNELFFPRKARPVLLRDLPRALENMFLHIRDEAHRFAVSYHRKLREQALGLTKSQKGGTIS